MPNLHDLSLKHSFTPTGILHVGAGGLEEAELYSDMGIKTVIWIEALPEEAQRAERAKEYGQTLYNEVAFAEQDGHAILSVSSNSGVSSSILPFARHATIYPDVIVTERRTVRTVRADHFFVNGLPQEIDTLVIDVQGAERQVLEGMGNLLNQIKRIWAEVNLKSLYAGGALKPELDQWLFDRGFWHADFYMVHWPEWGECLYRRP